jgi:predicted porin
MTQKNLLAAVALTAISSAALAQSNVTIYGLIDTNLEYTSHASASQNGLTRINSGGMNTSRLGFRGSEDLGSGLKAIFQLESGIRADTGAQDDTELFKRQANVGLEGGFGKVVMGRSYTTVYDFILPFDPMGYSAQYSWATSAGATGSRKDGMLTNAANLVKYQGQFGAVKLGATYAFGEAAGSSKDSAKLALGAAYAAGPFSTALAYDQVNGTVAAGGAYDKATTIHLAAGYQLGEAKLNGGYRRYKKSLASGAADLRSDLYWGGVNYQASPALTLTGAVYYQDIKNLASGADADPVMYVLRAKYALSKRTDLYAAGAYARAKNSKLVGVSRDDAGFDSTQSALTVGIQHRF